MARKIVFTNGNGDNITFSNDGPIMLTSVEGLGTPQTSLQEQKSPYQDGSTYIDALLSRRDIVCQVSITKPNDFESIDTQRRDLSRKLNPKLGQGVLTYYTESGEVFKISAIPIGSPVFPNKEYLVPFLRAQITFACNDPYWLRVTDSSLSLGTASTTTPLQITTETDTQPSGIQEPSGRLSVAVSRSSGSITGLVMVRSYDGLSWSLGSEISPDQSKTPSLKRQSDGSFRVVYYDVATSNTVQRTSADGDIWSAASTISTGTAEGADLVQLLDDSFIVFYGNSTGGIECKTSATGSSWSSLISIGASISYPSCVQDSKGRLHLVYEKITSRIGYKYSDDNGATWSSETVITSTTSSKPSIVTNIDDSLAVYCSLAGLSFVSSANGTNWTTASNIFSTSIEYPDAIRQSDGSVRIFYRNGSTNHIDTITRNPPSRYATVTGDVPAPFTVTFTGPSTNPRIVNKNTLEYIRLNTTLAASDSFIVNTAFGQKTVLLMQGGILKNGIAFLDIGSTFFKLAPSTIPAGTPTSVDVWNDMQAWWSMDETIPEAPDGTPVYLQETWATTDGWTGQPGTTSSVDAGRLKLVYDGTGTNGTSAYKAVSTWGGNLLRMRFTSTTPIIKIEYYNGSAVINMLPTKIISAYEWVVDASIAYTFVNFIFYINRATAVANTCYVDFIYIGTGQYSTLLADNSGNGKTGTMYGTLPVTGISGNGLAFNGSMSRVQTSLASSFFQQGFTLHCYFVPSLLATAMNGRLMDKSTDTAATDGFLVLHNASLDYVSFLVDGVTAVTTANSTFIKGTGYSLDITLDISGNYKVYRNGILLASGVSSKLPSEITTAGGFALGNRAGFADRPYYGIIDEARVYNRVLSESEVLYLYNNPGIDFPADANSIYFEDDAVASTATATMEWTERYVGI